MKNSIHKTTNFVDRRSFQVEPVESDKRKRNLKELRCEENKMSSTIEDY